MYAELIVNYRFPGRTVRVRHSAPFRITETCYAAHTVLPKHEHETAYISFLLAGGYNETYASRESYCMAGTVIWHPSHDTHADHFASTGGHMLNLEISRLQDISQEFKPSPDIRAFATAFRIRSACASIE